jgi:hypothetical protein
MRPTEKRAENIIKKLSQKDIFLTGTTNNQTETVVSVNFGKINFFETVWQRDYFMLDVADSMAETLNQKRIFFENRISGYFVCLADKETETTTFVITHEKVAEIYREYKKRYQ